MPKCGLMTSSEEATSISNTRKFILRQDKHIRVKFLLCCFFRDNFSAFIANNVKLLEETFPQELDWDHTLQQPLPCWSLQSPILNLASCKTKTHIEATIATMTAALTFLFYPASKSRTCSKQGSKSRKPHCVFVKGCVCFCICVFGTLN